jgi:hypothetical protein
VVALVKSEARNIVGEVWTALSTLARALYVRVRVNYSYIRREQLSRLVPTASELFTVIENEIMMLISDVNSTELSGKLSAPPLHSSKNVFGSRQK